jgi:glutamyl-Q tRNA(Asp) synthetase
MEDLDRGRLIAGCAAQMLHTLEAFGLHWDGAIEYQSANGSAYAAALQQLQRLDLTFQCSCSRRELADTGGYPGTCRAGARSAGPAATRFRVPAGTLSFEDRVQGPCAYDLAERGDVIIRRRDRAFAYQFAVVVDDARQEVTDVVRGADLLDSTPWQVSLQRALHVPTPRYAHLPLITEPGGAKLAKARRSVALEPDAAGPQLWQALSLLKQQPPAELKLNSPAQILSWGIKHWALAPLRGLREQPLLSP